jgi:hypothetical protein
MLLSPQMQRSKSWACEHCDNARVANLAICKTCYWASPDNYTHVALNDERRLELTFSEVDASIYDRLKLAAARMKITVHELAKRVLASANF